MNPVIVIPARMASTRLPGKPLADIAGLPMIVRVWKQAMAAKLGPVIVAAAEHESRGMMIPTASRSPLRVASQQTAWFRPRRAES